MDLEQSNSSIQLKPQDQPQESSFNAIIEQGDARYHEGKYLDSFSIYIQAQNMELDPYQAITINIKLGKASLKSGKYLEASDYFSKALELGVGLEGDNMLLICRIKIDLGRTCYERAKFSESAKYLEGTLNILLTQYPEEYNEIVNCYNSLSDLHYEQDKNLECLELLLKAQNIIEKNGGSVSIYKSATTDCLLGRVYESLSKYTEACHYTEKAFKKKVELHGQDHPEVALCLQIMGYLNCNDKKYEEGLEYFDKAIKIRLCFLGESHPLLSNSYSGFGYIKNIQEKYDEALEYYYKSLAVKSACHEQNYPDLADINRSIGSVLAQKGEFTKAIEHFSQALAFHSMSSDENQILIAEDYENIGTVFYFDLEDYSNAELNLVKALEIKLKQCGPKDPKLTQLYTTLGTLYHEQSEYVKAFPYLLKSIHNKARAKESIDLNECSHYYNLGLVFHRYRDLSMATNSLKKAKQAYSKLFGKEHSDVLDADADIMIIQRREDAFNLNMDSFY